MKIKIATLKELQQAVDFASKLQSNIETRCRPLPIDCTKEELYNSFKSYIEREEHDLILVYNNQELVGVTPYYWMTEDKYVTYYQGIYAKDYDNVASFILGYIEQNYQGYKFYVNTAREHIQSNNFYTNNDFTKLEDATMLELKPHVIDTTNFNIQLINEDNKKELYSSIDKLVDEDTYWNTDRLDKKLNNFIILGIFNPHIQGHIIGRIGRDKSIEIISLLGSKDTKEKLIQALINESYNQELRIIQLYTEENEEVEIGLSLGFTIYDNNVCYIKYL